MTWIYNNQPLEEIPDGYTSFVYLITNLRTGKMYVGKKLFKFTRTTKKKGKKVMTLFFIVFPLKRYRDRGNRITIVMAYSLDRKARK